MKRQLVLFFSLIMLSFFSLGAFPAIDTPYEHEDYDEINNQVDLIVNTKHYHLQETLVDKIINFCISLPNVKAARVKTSKTQAYSNCDAVGIEVFKWR